jgi:protein-disulfide isomerase
MLDGFLGDFDPELRVVVKHLPLPLHPKSVDVAEIAACVNAISGPNAFWTFFGKVADNAQKLDEPSLLRWAAESGATSEEFRKSLKDPRYQKTVRDDQALAGALMVRGTPTMFVNGRRVDGLVEASAFKKLIENEIALSKATLGIIPRSRLYAARVRVNVTSGQNDER